MPDGKNTWYWDSPLNADVRYETFISNELVKYVDSHYKTVADRKGRAITGLSMGGHGAMWNGLRHSDVFSLREVPAVAWISALSRKTGR